VNSNLIVFDTLHPYYLPQYIPVANALKSRGCEVVFVIYKNDDYYSLFNSDCFDLKYNIKWVNDEQQALSYYLDKKPNWVVFGNQFKSLNDLHVVSRSAQLGHGVGPKASYYTKSDTPMTVRFIEGEGRFNKIKSMYPDSKFIKTGFAKLDDAFKGTEKGVNLEVVGLDSERKTILYAPTFYPSSLECFPNHFPEDFSDYNIIVKPHFFSLTKPAYAKQRKLLESWDKYKNVFVPSINEQNLVPFMIPADILISEASSSLFEFSALGKPIVWCDFLKLRWSYRGPFSYRFKKRMDPDINNYSDLGAHCKKYSELHGIVVEQLMEPNMYADVRAKHTYFLVGTTDGFAADRVADYLLDN